MPTAVFAFVLSATLAATAANQQAQPGDEAPQRVTAKAVPARPRTGLLTNDPKACRGYTLLASANSPMTYLIHMQGRVVRTWKSDCNPGLSAYLLENGNLLRTGQVRNPPFFGGGAGGASRSSRGTAKSPGTLPTARPRNCLTMTSAGCPTATS